MTNSRRFLLLLAALFLLVTPALADTGNVNFILGSRSMSDDDHWDPFDTQTAFGVNVDFGSDEWPVRLCGGFHASAKTEDFAGTDVTGSVAELSFGVMKLWQTGHEGMVRPYVGGGLAVVEAEIDGGGISVDDNSLGGYVHGGVFWRLGKRFNIGVDGRLMLGTDIEFFGISGDADYAQIGLLLGWGWPAGK